MSSHLLEVHRTAHPCPSSNRQKKFRMLEDFIALLNMLMN